MSPVAAACASGASGEGDAEVVAEDAVVVPGGTAAGVGCEVAADCFAPPQPARSAATIMSKSALLTTVSSFPLCAEVHLNNRNPVRPRSVLSALTAPA